MILFLYTYSDIKTIFSESSAGTIIVLTITVVLVHVIKAFRLYLALYGKGVLLGQHIKLYCKVLPVSIIFPFKLGEVFRIYCYGYQIHSYFRGIVVILFDRFADTVALVTMIILIKTMSNSGYTPLFYLLLIFLVGLIACYLIFPGMYSYWKKYFLSIKASKRRNHVIQLLERFNNAYTELAVVVKGRGAILYILSLGAWIVEIGGLAISNKLFLHQGTMDVVNEYLTSALIGSEAVYLKQFVWISIVLMIIVYLCMHFMELFVEKGGKKNEHFSCI